MAIYGDIVNYCNFGPSGPTGPTGGGGGTGFWSVQQWVGSTSVTPGSIVRNRTPAVGSERCFIAITGGTAGSTEPAWTTTRGASNTDNTTIWLEATGLAGLNGDLTNTTTWTQLKNVSTPSVGTVIQRNNGASLQICQTAGTLSAGEPSFSDTAGVRTVDNTSVWISLGSPTNYKPWGAPHARIGNALTTNWSPFGASGGNPYLAAGHGTVFVGDTHAEYQTSAITWTPTITIGDLLKVICVDHTVINPTGGNVKQGATVSSAGPGVHVTINPSSGGIYFYGIGFQAGLTGQSNANINDIILTPSSARYYFDTCNFSILTGNAGSVIEANSASGAGEIVWNNCSVAFSAVGQYIDVGTSYWHWLNSTLIVPGSTGPNPTTLFGDSASGRAATVLLEGVDMTGYSGQLNGTQQAVNMRNFTVKDCKLNTSMTIAIPNTAIGEIYQLMDCEIGATGTSYKSSRYASEAVETTETSITRVGGAVDPAGNAQSRKIVTTTFCQFLKPYRSETLAIYNSKIGSAVTVTVAGTWNVASVPNNDDIWMEVEYLGTTTYPLGSFVTTTKANVLSSSSAVSSDSSTWNGGGSGAGWSPFKFSTTITPQFAGLIQVRIRAAKQSATFYIDPKIVLT